MKEIKEIFKRTTNSVICSSILAIIVGIILVVSPDMSIKTISMIAAIYIIIHGVLLVVLDIKAAKYYVPFDGLLTGIISIILGVVLLGRPNILSTIFTIAIGIWITLSSINIIKLSLIVIFNPFEASLSIAVFAGLMIIAHSVINIVDMLVIKKEVKNISKAIENQLKG